jgi:hypothetical protein
MQSSALQKFLDFKKQKEEAKSCEIEDSNSLLVSLRTEALKRKVLFKDKPSLSIPISKPIPKPEPEEPLFQPVPAQKPDQTSKTVISFELNSKEDIIARTNIFITGPVKDAILNAAGIFCKESNG